MAKQPVPPVALYESDETAWLELTADLVAQGRFKELDRENLVDYLRDMAKRDMREVENRLRLLMAHLLKWQYQPEKRSNSWRGTIVSQQHELPGLLDSGTLRKHADRVLAKCYLGAVEEAAAETGLPTEKFPRLCPYTVDWLLSSKLAAE